MSAEQLDLLSEHGDVERKRRNPTGDPFLDHPSCLVCTAPVAWRVHEANRGLCHGCVVAGRRARSKP
jgi:hypothetical protein